MIRSLVIIAILGTLLCAGLAGQTITPGVLLFKTTAPISIKANRTGLSAFDNYLDQLGAFNLRPISGMHLPQYFQVNFTQEPDWETIRSGSYRFDGIEYIQPNYLSKMHITPNDPLYPQQFHQVTSNPQAWNYTTGSSLVIVGVVDSGILREHPDLTANLYINPGEIPDNGIDDDGNGYIDDWCGWDFVDAPEMADTGLGDFIGQDNDVTDENFHGTHVSGIIGAVGNNGIGVTGVAWNVRLMPIRAGFRTTQGQGYLQDDDAAAAIIYAADNGCHVVNMSWGDANYSPIIGDACLYAYNKGVTLVASAGNDPGPYLSYPAKLSCVIAVGAVNRNRNLAGFSSYGPDLDLVAPGEAVLSTYKLEAGEQYFEQNGTSMSSPFVVGAAALLLSLQPGLTPDQVRARLLTATDDLGAVGFDQFYGHGLLNTRKLLENINPPLVSINYPLDQVGLTQSFDVTGTVQADNFFRFSVMYTNKAVPSSLDWYDVTTHSNTPQYYTEPVNNGVLAHFYFPDLFPEGNYTMRVQYMNQQGDKYNYYRHFTYDNSPPELKQNTLQGFKRYDRQNTRHYISAMFNEKVFSELIVTASDNSVYRAYGSVMDSLQVWLVPPEVPPGNIDIQFRATNRSGLVYESPVHTSFMNITYELVPNQGYIWQEVGQTRVPLNKMVDYSGDGYPEYVAMSLPTSGYGNVYAYQPGAAGHVIKHDFQDSFWLLSSGNTNAQGHELLLLKGDTAIIKEALGGDVYPNDSIWQTSGITGGVLADYSGDGLDDVLLVKNLPTERVIQAYKRGAGITFSEKNTLRNTSTTFLRNTFVPTIIVENFDNDNYMDILAADTDGDIMIYEIKNDNLEELAWTTRLPVGNTYQLAKGDFDGNGRQDFIVGGYYTDILEPNMNFWYFEAFKSTANNAYSSMGSIMFNQVMSQNSIQTIDIDNDGKDEVILALSPNIYVLKYIDGQFKPVFYGNSFRTYSILAYKDANNRAYFMTNYAVTPDSLIAVEWTADDPFTGPAAPANLLVAPYDHHSVQLSWIGNGAEHYCIYRKEENGAPELITQTTQTSYTDDGLIEGKTYHYTVTAVHSAYNPAESLPCLWQDATPYHVPVLERIEMVGTHDLRLVFDQHMDNSIINPGLYHLSHDLGIPVSVNSVLAQYGVQLHFRSALPAIEELFTLTLNNMLSANKVLMHDLTYHFPYRPDTEQPRVSTVTILPDQKTIRIQLSESISATNPNPEHLLNYILVCPANDPDNSIVSVDHQDDHLLIKLSDKLKHSNKAYHITIWNIADLAGNVISPQYNTARFALNNIQNLKSIVVYPNPVITSQQQWCSFINFPAGKRGKIRIFDTSGNLVFSSSLGPFIPEINSIAWRWDLVNNDNRKVSSGVYFYVIEMDGETARGKIAILR